MRGEHEVWRVFRWCRAGSSPLARGALQRAVLVPSELGIIPACAGSTGCNRLRWVRIGDHPRLRGEHELKEGVVVSVKGSSPLARGARRAGLHARAGAGIIPACAGSTRSFSTTSQRRRDHPRLRGEHLTSDVPPEDVTGSSPLARGARCNHVRRFHPHGIIPACAGSTCTEGRRERSHRDHPRLRGEHSSTK